MAKIFKSPIQFLFGAFLIHIRFLSFIFSASRLVGLSKAPTFPPLLDLEPHFPSASTLILVISPFRDHLLLSCPAGNYGSYVWVSRYRLREHAHLRQQGHRILTFHTGNSSNDQGNVIDDPSVTAQSLDPAFLLNPKATKRTKLDDDKDSQQSEVGFTGMSSMIERMHRVEGREHVVPKRRKVEYMENNENVNTKQSFPDVSHNGVLEEYMKEKHEKNESVTKTTTNLIDLTGEDDDEVTIVDAPDRPVCLGIVKDALVHVHIVPTPRVSQFQGTNKYWPAMKVKLSRSPDHKATTVIDVIDPSLRNFGKVDYKTSKVLAPLLDSVRLNNLRVEGRLETRKRIDGEAPGQPTSMSIPLLLLLYAPRNKAKPIGKFMKDRGVLLGNPNPLLVEKGFEVLNPHEPENSNKPKLNIVAGTSNYYASSLSGPTGRTVEEIRSDVMNMFDSLIKSEDIPEKEQDSRIFTTLLSHQKQALYFMTQREKDTGIKDDKSEGYSLWRSKHLHNGQMIYYNVLTGIETATRPRPVLGGILADMMGLGKTLSILSLIVDSLDDAAKFSKLCPPRSPDRFLVRNVKGTLLVCPLSTVANWEEQIKLHIRPGTIRYYIYHGSNRTEDVEELAKYDMIITGYQTLAAEYRRFGSKRPLFNVQFHRTVLDEAHIIRNRDASQSKAACGVAAEHRWAVTGTPVQNNLEDLGSLLTFLRIKPFDDKNSFSKYIIAPFKTADTSILPKLRLLVDHITLRRLKDRIDLPSRTENIVRLKFSEQERTLYDFFVNDSRKRVKALTAEGKALGGRTYAHVLKAILRIRLVCAHGRELLNDEDLKMAQGLTAEDAIEIGEDDEEKPALTPKQAFEMYDLLRESNLHCCAMCKREIGRNTQVLADTDASSSDDDKETDDIIGHMTPCYQIICPRCLDEFQELMLERTDATNHMQCPLCNDYVKIFFFAIKQSELKEHEQAKARLRANPRLAKQLGRYTGPHTKTKALMEALKEYQAWSDAHPNEKPIKTVIFSSWTSHLDLVEYALEANSFRFTRLDGSMSRKHRTENLGSFRDDPRVPIILVSIGAGGLGLNLTSANKVFVMEPQFNPAAEAQAVERVHRLGQTRDVEITRYIMHDSFEESMLNLQQKKKDLLDLSFNRNTKMDKADQVKERLESLRSLFR